MYKNLQRQILGGGFLILLGLGLIVGGISARNDGSLDVMVAFGVISLILGVPLLLKALYMHPHIHQAMHRKVLDEAHPAALLGRGVLGAYKSWQKFFRRILIPLLLVVVLAMYLYRMFEEEIRRLIGAG